MAAKKKKKQTVVCEGIVLSESVYKREENRLLTILLKGFIVYLLSMGSVGFYLSALDIKYNVLLCHVVISIMAFLCALLYYRLLVENLGYLVLLVGFAGIVYLLRYYINSGFYAIVNITVQNASEYFEVDIQKLYTEVITDRYITVTCVALFVGIVMDVFLNVYISRRMQYGMAVFAGVSACKFNSFGDGIGAVHEPDGHVSIGACGSGLGFCRFDGFQRRTGCAAVHIAAVDRIDPNAVGFGSQCRCAQSRERADQHHKRQKQGK